MIRAPKFFFVGVILFGIALLFGLSSLSLNIGTAGRMGPGYFPLMLAIALGLLAVAIVAIGFIKDGEGPGAANIRGILMVGLGVGFFAFSVRPLGLVPAVFVSSLLFSLAGREFHAVSAATAALVLTLGSWALFIVALGMPWRAFGSLFQ